MSGPRYCFLDTENVGNLAMTWGIHDQRVSYGDIVQEWFMISGQWSFNDQKKVHTVSLLDDPKRFKKDNTDDRHVVQTLRDVISSCDILVGHNIKGHDLKKIKAKVIEHGIEPIRMPQIVDTLQWSREFGFTSRKLGDLCKKLELTNKLSHEQGLFKQAALGSEDAIRKIVRYGVGDIPTCRELFYKLRPHANSGPNMNLYTASKAGMVCPRCGSKHLVVDKHKITSTGKYTSYQCKDCGKYCSGVKSMQKVFVK